MVIAVCAGLILLGLMLYGRALGCILILLALTVLGIAMILTAPVIMLAGFFAVAMLALFLKLAEHS